MKLWQKLILALMVLLALLGILTVVVLAVPSLNARVMNRVDQARIRIFYALNPPDQAVFSPSGNKVDPKVAAIVQATMTQIAAAFSPTPTATLEVRSTALPPDAPTPTQTPSPTPLPTSALIANVPYVDQHYGYNNCAPSNLTMALKFWGWPGTREQVSDIVKPFSKDKNVMPYELVDYVTNQTGFRALTRVGGTPDMLKRMIASGYPVIVESGVYLRDLSGVVSWMGHYQVVYGYDDAKTTWQIKDSFEQNGDHYTDTYDNLITSWRAFDYAFVVVYPPAQEANVMQALGAYADDAAANTIAEQKAVDEIGQLKGQDQFFAYFNKGTSLYRLADFNGSAQAYDQAFTDYATLSGDKRPWRMIWYQTGPYFAYFNTGRLQDVINLATKTINAASEPYIEESWYWRGRAKAQLGDTAGATEDLRKSLEYHPGFGPSVSLLQSLGVTP